MIFPAHERGSTKTKTGPHASLRRWPSSWRPLWYCSSPYTSLLCCSRSSCRVGVGRRSCSMTLIASAIGVEFLFFFFLSCTTPSRKPMLRVKKIFDFLIDFAIFCSGQCQRGEKKEKNNISIWENLCDLARDRARTSDRACCGRGGGSGGAGPPYHVGAVDSWPFSDRREDEGRLWPTLCMRRTAFRPLIRNPFSRRQVLCAQWSQ